MVKLLKRFSRRPKAYAGQEITDLPVALGPPCRVSPEAAKALGLQLGDAISMTMNLGEGGYATGFAEGAAAERLDAIEEWTAASVSGLTVYGEIEDETVGQIEQYFGLLITDVKFDGEEDYIEWVFPDGMK